MEPDKSLKAFLWISKTESKRALNKNEPIFVNKEKTFWLNDNQVDKKGLKKDAQQSNDVI